MNTLRHHILFILFIAIAFSTGCDSTAPQNDNNPPKDTVFLASEFKKVTINFQNILVIRRYEQTFDQNKKQGLDTILLASSDVGAKRASDGHTYYGFHVFDNNLMDPLYGRTSFSGYLSQDKSKVALLQANYYSTGSIFTESHTSKISRAFHELPITEQTDSLITVKISGQNADKFITILSDSSFTRFYASKSNPSEDTYISAHHYYRCVDSSYLEILIQK